MPVFRVRGDTKVDGSEGFLDIDCASESVARYAAIRNGLRNTTSIDVIDRAEAVDPIVVSAEAKRGSRGASRVIRIEHDITPGIAFKAGFFIAAGMFAFGLLAMIPYTLIAMVLASFK